jgi:hypothetical protein
MFAPFFNPFQMSHCFRRLIALLLMVTLPAYAAAALSLSGICPMQSTQSTGMADTGHACCEQADDDHGQPDKQHNCKSGQECNSVSLNLPAFPPIEQSLVVAPTVVSTPESLVLSRDPTGVWRPPRSL